MVVQSCGVVINSHTVSSSCRQRRHWWWFK